MVIFLGAFVSAVELPCTGAPYLAIITLLSQHFDFSAFLMLVLYNVIFVAPLIAILVMVAMGKKLHEGPFIPNFGTKGRGEKLTEGMVLALEPIVTLGSSDIELDEDGYTYTTKDGSLAAHFEHTILLTEKGAEVITKNI